jgi:hypothetical protein
MFKVRLVIYPVGGGEEQYSLDMMVPALPRQGDYLTVLRSGVRSKDERHLGSEDFWVRRVAWMFDYPDDGKLYHGEGDGPVGRATHIYVECEFAVTAYSSQSHRENAGPESRHFHASAD